MALEQRFLQLLELPTSAAASSVFLSLRETICDGKIHGVVKADPPRKSFLSTLLSTGLQTRRNIKRRKPPSPELSALREALERDVQSVVQQAGCWQVRTVAAQLRNMRDIRRTLVASARALDETGCGGSLLLVSGGKYEFWPSGVKLSFMFGTQSEAFLSLRGSFLVVLLRCYKWLLNFAKVESYLLLWAVENPLENTVDRLEKKILAGAETVILQPPLLQGRFEDWWDVAHSRGIMEDVRILVGLPLITSSNNLEFWFGLTQTSGKQVDLRLAKLRKTEAALSLDKQAMSDVYKGETLHLIEFIKNLPGVAGMHIMPVTPSGWHQFAALLMEQGF